MLRGVGPAIAKLDAIGTDRVCEAVCDGTPLKTIAASAKVSIGALLHWIEADPDRSARVDTARRLTAKMWDEKAEEVLRDKTIDIARSRELAHHYRWRSSKISPSYGDRVQQQALDKHGNPADQSPQVVIYQWAEPKPGDGETP